MFAVQNIVGKVLYLQANYFFPMLQTDTFQHKGLRLRLVEELRSKGITDESVLTAMGKIPRHFFIDGSFLKFAYSDRPFPISSGQTISQPFTVAIQTQLLKIKRMDKVLEVGTGSGYQTAVLCEMGARVYTVERHRNLFLKAKALLEQMNYRPCCVYGDGYCGVQGYSPFNKIIVTAGAPEIPDALVKQLAVGGLMVIPIGTNGQVMTLIEKVSETEIKTSTHGDFAFVPMLKGKV